MLEIHKAKEEDISSVESIYERIHDGEEKGITTIGWIRNVYPTRKTAQDALLRGDLFVMSDEGKVVAAAVINQIQVAEYINASWKHEAQDNEVMVLHTLVVDPLESGIGYGRTFVDFYEKYAAQQSCLELRMDTNARNSRARKLYDSLGYDEVGIVGCEFNGIPGVQLVCLEKHL